MQSSALGGFSLIELIVVLTVAGILAAVGLPGLENLILTNRIAGQSNEFITAFNLARSEAIKRGAPVCLRKTGANSGSWTEGWEVFVDKESTPTLAAATDLCKDKSDNPDNLATTPATPPVLQTYDALASGSTLQSSDFPGALRFNAMGVVVSHTGAPVSGNLRLCPRNGKLTNSRKLAVSVTGSIHAEQNTVSCP